MNAETIMHKTMKNNKPRTWLGIALPILLALSILHYPLATVKAQGEADNWYFGSKAGIKFVRDANGNVTGTQALTDGELNTYEGCSTISDRDGNLLFYTDGTTVWNKNHQSMPNGTGLSGHSSATQSGTVVPKPGSPNEFIIVTVGEGSNPMHYSVVDMALDGGLGDVTVKNVLLMATSSEKVAVTKHANGLEYWIVGHVPGTTEYQAFLLDCGGVSTTPVVSHGTGGSSSGYSLAISPDGSKLAATYGTSGYELADFDNATGKVSSGVMIYIDTHEPYGLAFSPNSRVLYGTNIQDGNIHQWDLDAANIPDSRIQVGTSPSGGWYTGGALQLGPDGKIYVAQTQRGYLGVISSPNTVGVGCGYDNNAVFLGGKICQLGLPPFVSSFFAPPVRVVPGGGLSPGASVPFEVDGLPGSYTSIDWDFGDGSPTVTVAPGSPAPEHAYANPGAYTVTATVNGVNCSLSQVVRDVVHVPWPLVASPDKTICPGDNVELAAVSGGDEFGYEWFLPSGTTPFAAHRLAYGDDRLYPADEGALGRQPGGERRLRAGEHGLCERLHLPPQRHRRCGGLCRGGQTAFMRGQKAGQCGRKGSDRGWRQQRLPRHSHRSRSLAAGGERGAGRGLRFLGLVHRCAAVRPPDGDQRHGSGSRHLRAV